MNESGNQSETTEGPALEALRTDLQILRMMMAVALVMLIGLSIGADYFLSKQVSFQAAETTQMQMIVNNFPQNVANDFVKRLQDYYKTHPDFAPIAAKYSSLFGMPPSAQSLAQPVSKPAAKK